MTTATSQYIKINKLYGMKEGSTNISAAKAVYGGSTFSKRVWAGSELVYDVWDTTLSADNFEIPATGGNVEDYVEIISEMTSVEGENENISYSLNITNISPNTTTSSKTHNIVITQELTGESITIVCTQEANSQLNVSYGTPTVVDTATEMIEAAGGSTMLLVQYSQVKTTYYANGTSSNETITGNTVAENIKGTVSVSGASTDGTYVEMGSAEDTVYSSARTVYTITDYTIEVNGKSKTVTGASIAVKQEANIASYSSWSYNIYATTTTKEYTAASVSVRATVSSTRSRTCTYTSGYDPYGNNNEETQDYAWTASITSATGNSVTSSGSAGDTTAEIDLGPNTSTTSVKTTTVTFKSAGDSSKTSTITFTQSKDSLESTTTSITVYNATVGQALASGGTVPISLTLKVVSTPLYASGNTGTPTTTYPTATVTSFEGSAQNSSGAYKNTAGTGVIVKSAGTTEHSSVWTVYKITSVTGTYNGKSYTWSGTLNVQQEANTSSTSYSDYTITCSTTTTTVSAESSTFNVTAGCYRTKYLTWTSGSESSTTEYGKVIMSGDNCSCSPTSYTSSSSSPTGTIEVTTDENITFSSRECTVYATDPNGKSKSISVTQEPVSFTFVADETEYDTNATANTVNIVIESTRNNKPWGIASSNVSISPSNVASVGTITSSGSNYIIPISLEENTGNSRTITVTITQPSSNDTKTITINQASGVVKEIAGINIYECAYTDETATKVSYNFTVTAEDTNKYSGGSVGSVKVALNTMPNGSGTVVAGPTTLASSLTVSAGTESSVFSGTFTVPSQYSGGVYLIIYLNNEIADYSDIEEIIPE